MRIAILPSEKTNALIKAYFPHIAPDDLYDYWVNSALLPQWWVPSVTYLDATTGGNYQFDWPDQGWTLRGEFKQVVGGERLVFTWAWDHLPDYPTRTVDALFLPDGRGGTRLHVHHGTYDASLRDQADRQSHIDGWHYFLEKLMEITQ